MKTHITAEFDEGVNVNPAVDRARLLSAPGKGCGSTTSCFAS